MFGDDSTSHLHLHEEIERTRKADIKLNFDKCIIKSKSSTFLGKIDTPQGAKPNAIKIQANVGSIKETGAHSISLYGKLLKSVHTCNFWFNLQPQESPE